MILALATLSAAAVIQAPAATRPIAPSIAQTTQRVGKSAFRNAGTYHAASGTWTRAPRGPVAAFGPDTIFSNTSNTDTITVAIGSLSQPGQITYDEGVLPTPANFTPGIQTQPDRGIYEVNGFEIKYCDFEPTPASAGWNFTFYEDYAIGSDPELNGPAAATVALSSLPSNGCWTITIDLEGGFEFDMRGDGAPGNAGWQNDLGRDSFAVGVEYAGLGSGAAAGMGLAGDPEFTGGAAGRGAGTYYLDPNETGTSCGTTGLGAQDGFTIKIGTQIVQTPATYANGVGCGMGTSPFSSIYLKMFASPGPGASMGQNFCVAALNSNNTFGRMTAIGSLIASEDKVRLEATGLTPEAFAYFLTSTSPGFSVAPGGSVGNLCLSGNIGRYVSPSQIKNSGPEGRVTLDTRAGEWSLTAHPTATGSVPVAVGETWYYTAWYRDISGGMAVSNFADGVAVTYR